MSTFLSDLRRLAAVLCMLVFLSSPAAAGAAESSSIPSYDVDILVDETGLYHVTENIRMVFAEYDYSHGMYRQIPLEPHVFFEQDGRYYARDYDVQITDVQVNEPFTVFSEDGSLVVRVGEEDVYVNGETIDYELSYVYDPGDDGYDAFDMFYFGIVGNEWGEPVDNVTFRIQMPKQFDEGEIGFSVGWSGDSGYDPELLRYSVDGNVITGEYLGVLSAYEGIWIRIALPNGYFTFERPLSMAARLTVLGSGVLGAAFLLLFLLRREKRRPVVTVEVTPPDGLTPADIGYIMDEKAEDRDIISLLLYWASKGCIKIVEILPQKPTQKPKDLLFVRLRDLPPDANDYEKDLYRDLFAEDERVSTQDLKYSFYKSMTAAKKALSDKFSGDAFRVTTKRSRKLSGLCTILAPIPAALMGAVSAAFGTYSIAAGVVGGFFLYVIGIFLAAIWSSMRQGRLTASRKKHTAGVLVWSAAAAVYYAVLFLASFRSFQMWGLVPAAASLVLVFTGPAFVRYTDNGLSWTGRILGLKRFIERAEKDRLEMLAEENPSYFYDILPFAYVLGVSEVWADRFAALRVPPPSWYAGGSYDTFNTILFTQALTSSMQRAQSALAASPASGGSSGGGGGFSGGGFSGGGFGGGGGGRW